MYGTSSLRYRPDLFVPSFSAYDVLKPVSVFFTLISTDASSPVEYICASVLEAAVPNCGSAKLMNTVPVMVGDGVGVAVFVIVGVGSPTWSATGCAERICPL